MAARYQFTVVDEQGNVVPSAQVEVRREVAGQPLVSLYTDRDLTTLAGNPITADEEGFVGFHVVGGAYRIRAYKGDFERIWRYVGIGTASEYDLEEIEDLAVIQYVDAGYPLLFEANTSTPPTSGSIRFNNADLSSATEAYVSANNASGSGIGDLLLDLYSAERTRNDSIIITDPASNKQTTFDITGATDNSTYVTLALTSHRGETSFSDGIVVNLQRDRVGVDGPQGIQGEQGIQGVKGDKGDTGEQGPPGEGDVTGPGSATAGNLASYADSSGSTLADSGLPATSGTALFGAIKQAATTDATGVVEKATTAEVRAATADKYLSADHLDDAAAPVALSDASTVAVNWTAGINFTLTVAGNRTLGNPTNEIPGTWRTVLVQGNDGTARTLSFGNEYGGSPPTLDDITSTQKYLVMIYCKSAGQFLVSAIDGSDA